MKYHINQKIRKETHMKSLRLAAHINEKRLDNNLKPYTMPELYDWLVKEKCKELGASV